MKETIDLIAKTLEKDHLNDCIPDNARKNTSLQRGNGHALLLFHLLLMLGFFDSWSTHHMASSDRLFSYLQTCSRPPIFMGDDYP
jgi:hypothetical protein